MKSLILTSLLSISSLSFAGTFIRPVGTFTYTKHLQLNKKRTAETISHLTSSGQERIQVLKKDGFLCVRKNQQLSICQKTESGFTGVPAFLQKAADDFLANAKFVFPGEAEPVIVHDGSNTEWLIQEEASIGNTKINAYKIVHTKDDKWYVSLPMNNEQGISILELYSDTELLFPLTVERKENAQTVGYFFTSQFLAQ